MSDRDARYPYKSPTPDKLDSTPFRVIAKDEEDAYWANNLVKRKNKQIRRERRAAKILPVTLAKMPWDE